MKLGYSLLVFFQVILLQVWCTQGCNTTKKLSGTISRNLRNARYYSECWYIDVPEESYIKMDLIDIRSGDPYCSYMYLEVVEETTGQKHKICRYDYYSQNWTRTFLSSVNLTAFADNSWSDYFSFTMLYHIESVACAKEEHFRCSKNKCILPKQICDGIEDCEDGSDEDGCGLPQKIKGISVIRKNAIDWLKKRQRDYGWGRNTHRAITALYLTGAAQFRGKEIEEEVTVKELELKTATALLRDSTDPLSANELSMYVNAMLVTCHNPRNLFGKDLLKLLDSRAVSSSAVSPGAYLTLCSANSTLSEFQLRQLLRLLSENSEYPFAPEIQAMSILALSCILQKTNLYGNYLANNSTDVYYEAIIKLAESQNSDGSFGNAHTTAIVTQALLASGQGENHLMWNVTQALRYLTKSLNSTSIDFLSVYLSLPLLKGKTLLDVGKIDCSGYKRRLEDDDGDITDVMDRMSGNVQVQYSLYIGDQKNIIHTIHLRVPENSTAFDVMRVAQLADSKYKFSYYKLRDQVYVYEVAGINNDMEVGKYWMFHKLYSGGKKNVTDHLRQYNSFASEIVIEDGDHLVLWYKTMNF